ncbi:MAG TPA: M1 family metallopeptidase [Flavipsychrobacter sp.]|nr:M1 family metallopeptidase [Flavipsychrobacter sp.]
MKYLLVFIISLLSTYSINAQAYWQQQVDTKIDVKLDDENNFLYAHEEMTYINNSPDTLKYIYMHLWPNAYKNDYTEFATQMDINGQTEFYYSKPSDRGYMDSLQFTIDGQNVDYNNTDKIPDIARIDLPNVLLPGHQIKIATPFRVKIPKVFSRLGHTDQAYYISQWFPKPAVYDKKGWHPISYKDQGEFFSNFGSYDVSITLPKNYIVMATGDCTDTNELLWLDSLSKQKLPSDTLYNHSWPASSGTLKTIHYHQDNVHDFAWFADKRWIVRKDTFYTSGNNQLITAWVAFLPEHKSNWIYGTSYLRKTVKYYGTWIGSYPYSTIKAVEGNMHAGGGMEYPTVTIIDKSVYADLESVVVHEAGHNWFYGILGTDERDYAWMDEGINTFYEEKTLDTLGDDTKSSKLTDKIAIQFYYEAAATNNDQAINQTSSNFTKTNYGLDVYYKTAMMLRWLEQYMGEDNFQKAIQEYFQTWRFKHPYPEDLEAILQKHTDKPLDKFFISILNTDKKIDYSVSHATKDGETITIRSKNNIIAPVAIDVYQNDSLLGKVWSLPFTHDTTITLPPTYASWTKIKIDSVIPDGKTANNEYKRYGLFHTFGLKIAPFLGWNRRNKEKLFIAPSVGYNEYDGFMVGLLFHDLTIPENRFRFALAPLYSTNNNSFVGAGSVGYIWYPHGLFKNILLQADGKTFHYNETNQNSPNWLFARYTKVAPSLNFVFNEHDPLSTVTRTLALKGYFITEDNFDFGVDSLNQPSLKQQQEVYGLLRYLHQNNRTFNPFSYSLEGQLGADFAKINLEANIRIDYFKKNKALYMRGYIGKFFPINNDPTVAQRYYLNSTFTGLNDYLYDGTYIGRSSQNGLGAQQISMQEGGLKIPTYNNIGRSDDWLVALNLKTDLPFGNIPIRLFADVAALPNSNPDIQNMGNIKIQYDAGVEIYLLKDIVSVYLPVIISNDFQNYLKNNFKNNQFGRSISFTLQLQNINWLPAPTKAEKFLIN